MYHLFLFRLKEFEVGLTAILGDQGKNVDELVRLVGENREIIDRMKVNILYFLLQNHFLILNTLFF